MYGLHKYLHKIQKCSKNYNTNFGIFVLLKKGEVGLKSVFFFSFGAETGFLLYGNTEILCITLSVDHNYISLSTDRLDALTEISQ